MYGRSTSVELFKHTFMTMQSQAPIHFSIWASNPLTCNATKRLRTILCCKEKMGIKLIKNMDSFFFHLVIRDWLRSSKCNHLHRDLPFERSKRRSQVFIMATNDDQLSKWFRELFIKQSFSKRLYGFFQRTQSYTASREQNRRQLGIHLEFYSQIILYDELRKMSIQGTDNIKRQTV